MQETNHLFIALCVEDYYKSVADFTLSDQCVPENYRKCLFTFWLKCSIITKYAKKQYCLRSV